MLIAMKCTFISNFYK